jgi:hypothetical protein
MSAIHRPTADRNEIVDQLILSPVSLYLTLHMCNQRLSTDVAYEP